MGKQASRFLLAAAVAAIAAAADAQSREDATQRTRLAQACGIELRLSATGCLCVADRATRELTDLQRDYLLATSVAPAAADRIRRSLAPDDIRTLARFIAAAELECSTR